MRLKQILTLLFLICASCTIHIANAESIDLMPKYGAVKKNDAQLEADKTFIAAADAQFKGDRKKAAEEISARGWQFLKQGNAGDAMRRFNQAWLLDPSCGDALWGMAAISGNRGKLADSVALFAEAEPAKKADLDFEVDYARNLSVAGAQAHDQAALDQAFSRFAQNYERDPQHVVNLQNWAIASFYTGNYADAWKKVELAEKTPQHAMLDARFVAALQEKMPRP